MSDARQGLAGKSGSREFSTARVGQDTSEHHLCTPREEFSYTSHWSQSGPPRVGGGLIGLSCHMTQLDSEPGEATK